MSISLFERWPARAVHIRVLSIFSRLYGDDEGSILADKRIRCLLIGRLPGCDRRIDSRCRFAYCSEDVDGEDPLVC